MADPIGSFQGLASGIDFRELVDAVIAAEATPVLLLSERKAQLDLRSTAWSDVELRVSSALSRAKDLADPDTFNTWQTSISGGEAGFSASAGSTALPGSYSVEVLQLATREKVGSDAFQDRAAELGFAGEFVVDGRAVQVTATDSLDDIAAAINAASERGTGGGATASVVGASSGDFRIVLTAGDAGKQGIALSDGAAGTLKSLGFMDAAMSIQHQTSNGAKSDGFKSTSTDIATLLGLTSAPAAGSVTIGGLSVAIDLSSDSLTDIADAINTAAGIAGSPIDAQVVVETDASGGSVRRIDIGNTTSFVDTNGILETLGIVAGGRGAVTQQVQGAAFTDGDAVTAATGSTLLSDLWVDGASASVQVGDTLALGGTRGDGSTFTKTFTVGASDTYQDLVDSLNSASDGYGFGTSTATASIVGGQVTVTDDIGGSSRLSLSIISNNEGGGSLDFGDFTTTSEGRDREITQGVDAEMLVDGAFYTRSTNTVSDVLSGVTLNLSATSASGASTVEVERDVDAIVSGIDSFIKSFNAVSEFVLGQFTGVGAEEGESKRPLSGDRNVRAVRDSMRAALQTAISSSVSSFGSLTELGIEANRDGLYEIDSAVLKAAVESDPVGVQRIFSEYGGGSVSTLDYVSAGSEAETGTYDVFVSTPAAQAVATGSGFGGTYVDDGTPDVMTITDTSTGSDFDVSLSNGMTLGQIVDAINTELQTATTRQVTGPNVMHSDAVGTLATDSTLLQDLHSDVGTNLNIATGDAFTVSGTRDDGSSFFRQWTVSDAATQTLGTLRSEISAAMGTDVVVDVSGGQLSASALEQGSGSFTLSVSSDNLGGGTFSQGGFTVTEEGRGVAMMTASDSGGELAISHGDFGSATGFTVAFTAGGTDGSASLAVAANSYAGIDVVGTIGGYAATGNGVLLTGDEGSAVDGLVISYDGAASGAAGSINFSRGIASIMEGVTDGYLNGGEASIQGIQERIDTQKRGIDDRIERFEERLEVRRQNMIRRFTALEEALAQAQTEGAWLQAQLGSLLQPQQQSRS